MSYVDRQVYQRVMSEHDGAEMLKTFIDSLSSGRRQLEHAQPNKDLDKIWAHINGV